MTTDKPSERALEVARGIFLEREGHTAIDIRDIALALDGFAAEEREAEKQSHARQLIAQCNKCDTPTWYGEAGICAPCAIAARREGGKA